MFIRVSICSPQRQSVCVLYQWYICVFICVRLKNKYDLLYCMQVCEPLDAVGQERLAGVWWGVGGGSAEFKWSQILLEKNKYPPSFETSAFKHKLNCDCFILTTDFTWTLRFYHTDANIFKM